MSMSKTDSKIKIVETPQSEKVSELAGQLIFTDDGRMYYDNTATGRTKLTLDNLYLTDNSNNTSCVHRPGATIYLGANNNITSHWFETSTESNWLKSDLLHQPNEESSIWGITLGWENASESRLLDFWRMLSNARNNNEVTVSESKIIPAVLIDETGTEYSAIIHTIESENQLFMTVEGFTDSAESALEIRNLTIIRVKFQIGLRGGLNYTVTWNGYNFQQLLLNNQYAGSFLLDVDWDYAATVSKGISEISLGLIPNFDNNSAYLVLLPQYYMQTSEYHSGWQLTGSCALIPGDPMETVYNTGGSGYRQILMKITMNGELIAIVNRSNDDYPFDLQDNPVVITPVSKQCGGDYKNLNNALTITTPILCENATEDSSVLYWHNNYANSTFATSEDNPFLISFMPKISGDYLLQICLKPQESQSDLNLRRVRYCVNSKYTRGMSNAIQTDNHVPESADAGFNYIQIPLLNCKANTRCIVTAFCPTACTAKMVEILGEVKHVNSDTSAQIDMRRVLRYDVLQCNAANYDNADQVIPSNLEQIANSRDAIVRYTE